ncbi:MAG: hypothetical protein GY794_26430 [bacterium]|nr:hypothetical protein [bacterium]
MMKTNGNKRREQAERRRKFWPMLLAICGAHGIPAAIREDVAAEVASTVYRAPPEKFQALAHRIARRCLAMDLGFSEREIPHSRVVSSAIAQYEYARLLREVWQCQPRHNEDWVGGFDYHSRQFAIENGVCPRCSRSGDFTADAGVCECGYSY